MKRLLTTAAAFVVLTSVAFAKDDSPGLARATFAVMVAIHVIKCNTKPTDNAVNVSIKYRDEKAYTDKQFDLAIKQQKALISVIGQEAWCLVSEGGMSKMDKDIAAARGQ